jgi:hypothetical protein
MATARDQLVDGKFVPPPLPSRALEEQALMIRTATSSRPARRRLCSRSWCRLIASSPAKNWRQTSRMMLLDTERQSQAPYVSRALLENHAHSLAEKITRFLTGLHSQISVSAPLTAAPASQPAQRHFARTSARPALSSASSIASARRRYSRPRWLRRSRRRCGYSDVPSFRKLFKRETTLTPGDYRERFRLRASGAPLTSSFVDDAAYRQRDDRPDRGRGRTETFRGTHRRRHIPEQPRRRSTMDSA